MQLIRILVLLFWGVTLLSAIYLRTAVYSSMPLLFGSSLMDVFVLLLLSIATHLYLKKMENHSIMLKGIVIAFFILISLLLRYYSESLFMGFGFSFESEISVKFVYTKLITSLGIAGVTVAYHILEKYNEVRDQKTRTEIDKKQMELEYLKSRINPHFLFNTLGSIHSLAIAKSDKTAPMIEELSSLMRYMFYDCQEEFILLSKEINFIENYIELNQLKSQKPLLVSFDYSQSDYDFKIEPLLFISFIENAFKHGNINFGGHIFVSLVQDEKGVSFVCKNTYETNNIISSASKQSGFGLENIINRLNYIYSNRYQLNIEKHPEFTVKLNIKN